MPQRDIMNMKRKFEIPDIKKTISYANKFVTLSGACQSKTFYKREKLIEIKERQRRELEAKRMAII
jgi:hypothetical protein